MTTKTNTRWGEVDENGIIQYDTHYKQGLAIMSDKRFVGACAGTGGGKTVSGPLWLMNRITKFQEAGNKSGYLGFIVAPTSKILRRATLPCFIKVFNQSHLKGRHIPSRSIYILPNNLGVIWTLSADNPEGLVGGQCNDIWLDEGGQCSQHVWDELQQRTGVNKGHIFVTSTPYRANWFKTELVDKALAKDPDYAAFIWASIDNPAYPREEYERAKRALPTQLFQMRYNARFTMSEGRIYYAFDMDENVVPCPYDPSLPLIVSSDFNVNPMSWCILQRHGNNLKVIDEICIENTNTIWTLDILYNKYNTHKAGFQFFGDASSRNRHTSTTITDYQHIANDERFKTLGRTIHYLNANPSILDRYAAVNGMLCSAAAVRSLHIDTNCKHLIKDIESCFYKENTRKMDTKGNVGHITDALGYCVYNLFPIITVSNPVGRVSVRRRYK